MSNSNAPETAILIRTRNEERWIGEVLHRLFQQTYSDFEVVAVDSGSTDNTLNILKQFPVKLLQIKPEEFSYPFALNIGVGGSSATDYVCILSAHSLPLSKIWLESAVKLLKAYPDTMGVYGPLKGMPDGTIWDKLFHNPFYLAEKIKSFPHGWRTVHKNKPGVLGFTNALIRKELWEQRHFNEEYGAGGEDGEWADYWFRHGYNAIKDTRFAVYHSHYLTLRQWYGQIKHWQSVASPHPFEYLRYRSDPAHRAHD